jgi:hypothetical protein
MGKENDNFRVFVSKDNVLNLRELLEGAMDIEWKDDKEGNSYGIGKTKEK